MKSTVEEEGDLTEIGATVRDAGTIEQQVLREFEETAGHGEPNTLSDVETLYQQLRAIHCELRTVRSAVSRLENAERTEAPDPSTEPLLGLAQGQLQEALMKERMSGLEAQAAVLVQQLEDAGFSPEPTDNPEREKAQDQSLGTAARGLNHNKPQKKRKVQLNLEEADLFGAGSGSAGRRKGASLVETERDRLIRLGVLTPFDRLGGFERRVERNLDHDADASIARVGEEVRRLREARHTSKLVEASELPRPSRAARKIDEGFWRASASKNVIPLKKRRKSTLPPVATDRRSGRRRRSSRGSDYESDESDEDKNASNTSDGDDESYDSQDLDALGRFDDADDATYRRRQRAYRRCKKGSPEKCILDPKDDGEENDNDNEEIIVDEQDDSEDENDDDVIFEGGFRVPREIYGRLFDYQRTGVKWLWELHTQRAGGIIGDDMGLGKTIQIIAFLAGLHRSGLFKPTLIVCPATVLTQWLRELRAWYPPFRVAILHSSASGPRGGGDTAIIHKIARSRSGVLLTTYDQLRIRRSELLPIAWGYAILDEGHKIRNPDAEITLVCKQLATVHRLIMTGSPIQNRLTELWSLFDFVFPGKLGTLPVFQAQFAIPIQIGGYSNASALQVSAAYKCAVILRDMIAPYLLRRRKADVAASLPKKTERVLFCSLTPQQRDLYRSYLASKELSDILAGNRMALAGIDVLRKICNHPDLLERARWEGSGEYGGVSKSGKLVVLDKVLSHWNDQGHKALIFTQTQQMLDIIEKAVTSRGWRFHRMDGSTPVATRARLIDDFNTNPGVFCFLLTTRVGGLGVNLTGANRCVIFDPDWNPSTDVQARERAWRIGQSREVTVYRLITSGTIEEKVYHRQVYKQFLTDRVLRDPRQRRYFKSRDLADLFTLGDEYADGTETAEIFAALDTEIRAEDLVEGGPSNKGNPPPPSEDESQQQRRSQEEDILLQGGTDGMNGRGRTRPSSSEVDPSETSAGCDDGDAGILRDLFDGTGVHAALDHNKIESAHNPEKRVAEREAAKIAQRAAEALRRSRTSVQDAPLTQPTWTGRSGLAGAPRFGAALNPRVHLEKHGDGVNGFGGGHGGTAVRSAYLLGRMRERQAAASTAGLAPEVAQAQILAQRLASFLSSRGGQAASAEVAAEFRREVGASDAALFKGVLRQVAVLQRRLGGKRWVLRPEFAVVAG